MEKQLLSPPADLPRVEKQFRRGQIILEPTRENSFFHILIAGEADVCYQSENGEVLSMYTYRAADFFGEDRTAVRPAAAAAGAGPQRLPGAAAAPGRPAGMAHRDFAFTRAVLKRLCEKLLEGSQARARLTLLPIRERYLLAVRRHRDMGDLDRLTKAQLCEELGVPLRSLNRVAAGLPRPCGIPGQALLRPAAAGGRRPARAGGRRLRGRGRPVTRGLFQPRRRKSALFRPGHCRGRPPAGPFFFPALATVKFFEKRVAKPAGRAYTVRCPKGLLTRIQRRENKWTLLVEVQAFAMILTYAARRRRPLASALF